MQHRATAQREQRPVHNYAASSIHAAPSMLSTLTNPAAPPSPPTSQHCTRGTVHCSNAHWSALQCLLHIDADAQHPTPSSADGPLEHIKPSNRSKQKRPSGAHPPPAEPPGNSFRNAEEQLPPASLIVINHPHPTPPCQHLIHHQQPPPQPC